jgi:hypothetical protein
MLNQFLLTINNIQHARDIALIASGRYPLFLVNLVTADNYHENLIDNFCCENWKLPNEQIAPTNIVTYAIAKVVNDAEQMSRVVDLDQVWRLQRVPVILERAFMTAAEIANEVIANPLVGMRNIREWAKKQGCWAELAKRKIAYEREFVDTLIDPEEARARQREERQGHRDRTGVEAQREVVLLGGEYWLQVLAFGESIGKLDPRESGILRSCANLPLRIPTERQCLAALKIVEKLEQFYPVE